MTQALLRFPRASTCLLMAFASTSTILPDSLTSLKWWVWVKPVPWWTSRKPWQWTTLGSTSLLSMTFFKSGCTLKLKLKNASQSAGQGRWRRNSVLQMSVTRHLIFVRRVYFLAYVLTGDHLPPRLEGAWRMKLAFGTRSSTERQTLLLGCRSTSFGLSRTPNFTEHVFPRKEL